MTFLPVFLFFKGVGTYKKLEEMIDKLLSYAIYCIGSSISKCCFS